MTKFKEGDRVRRTRESFLDIGIGDTTVVDGIEPGRPHWLSVKDYGKKGGTRYPFHADYFELATANECVVVGEDVKFILQYELDEDPFETFSTMKGVEDRIKELAKRPDLKRENIKVYEIANIFDVALDTKITFHAKVKLTEKKAKKSTKKRK